MHYMFEIECISCTEFDKLLQQVHLGELDVVDSHLNERLDMSEKLLDVVSTPADHALNTSGMSWKVSSTVFRS